MSVVVGYVATPEGDAALGVARAEASARGDRIIVVLSERGHRFGTTPADLTAQVERVREQLADCGIEHEVRQAAAGSDVAEDLIAAAKETEARLIVIGLRRRSPVGKLILGSNAQRILLDAPCPVLAVKP